MCFLLETVTEEAVRSLNVAESINQLYEEMKGEFADCLASKWSISALDFVFQNPVYRNNKFLYKSGIPKGTAARFTRILYRNKLISMIESPSGNQSALYSFEPLIKLVRV